MVYSVLYLCRSDGMADVTDSKSVGSDTVWVRVPPSAPRRSKVRFAPASFFCLRQKKTPSARSLAPPFQLRPALLARSWQAALRAAFFSNRRSRGFPRSFQAGGPSALLRRLFSACGKKDAIRTLPCSSFPTATRFAGSQLAGRPAGGILLQSEVSGGPVPSRPGAVRFAPIFFVPGKKRHPHARPAILRCGFSIPYFLRSLKTRQALRPFPFSLDVLRAWFVSNLQKKCPVLHFGTFLFLPSCYILCIERNMPQ